MGGDRSQHREHFPQGAGVDPGEAEQSDHSGQSRNDRDRIGPEKIARINELARKAKAEGLTEVELEEQQALRAAYLAAVRANFKAQLDAITGRSPDEPAEP